MPEPDAPAPGAIVEPRTLRGFRDLLPDVAEQREALLAGIRATYAAFGFRPIATPALEHLDVLAGKGGEEQDRQMFTFTDQGGREVGMRFDLTVPLARFVAEHHGQLELPLRCYQIGPVWRGERPQRGRYREFVQCDADLIGPEHPAADAEVLAMFHAALTGLGIGEVQLRVNDRRILNGLLDDLGLAERSVAALRALDKVDKVGVDGVLAELAEAGITGEVAERIVALPGARGADDAATLAGLAELVGGSEVGVEGLTSLRTVRELLADAGVPDAAVAVDPAIARGLDYYTGTVFETTYLPAPAVGSVCSGGRYDNLTLVYSKQRFPGVGGSIGIDRLVAAVLEEEGRTLVAERNLVVVAHGDDDELHAAVRLAARLRAAGLHVEVYPEQRAVKKQRQYALRRGAAGFVTFERGEGTDPAAARLQDLRLGDGETVPVEDAPARLAALLARPSEA